MSASGGWCWLPPGRFMATRISSRSPKGRRPARSHLMPSRSWPRNTTSAPSGACGGSKRSACAFSMPMVPDNTCLPSNPPVVPYFLRQAIRNGTLVIHGDGHQTRDYVYVDDVVSAMIAAATAPNINGLVINVGSGIETSLRTLSKLVLEVTGSEASVVHSNQTSGGSFPAVRGFVAGETKAQLQTGHSTGNRPASDVAKGPVKVTKELPEESIQP